MAQGDVNWTVPYENYGELLRKKVGYFGEEVDRDTLAVYCKLLVTGAAARNEAHHSTMRSCLKLTPHTKVSVRLVLCR